MAARKPVHPDTSIITKWLKRIFSWKILTGIITIVGLLMGVSQFLRERGGDISMTLNGREVFNNEKINNIVFVESRSTHIGDFFVPTLVNNKEYSVRDFFLQYDLETGNVAVTPSDFYNIYRSGNGMALRYKDNVLYSFTDAESPLTSLLLTADVAWLNVKMKATYDGVSQPYGHEINTRFYVEPMGNGVQFDQWKEFCKEKVIKRTDALRFNTYFIAQNKTDFETIVTTSAMEEYDSKMEKTQTKAPSADSNPSDKSSDNQAAPRPQPKVEQPSKQVSPATSSSIKAEPAQSVNSLEIPAIANAPLNITSIDTLTLSDGSLMATINFEKLKEPTTAYIAFDYTRKKGTPKNRRYYGVSKYSLYPGNEYCKLTYSDFHKYNDNLRFIGFATEDESLASNVEIKKLDESTKLSNESDTPIWVIYTTTGGGTSGIALDGSSSLIVRDEVAGVKCFRLPATDWRKSTWDKVFYSFDGSLSGWALLIIFVCVFVGLVMFIILSLYLSDKYEFWRKYDEWLVVLIFVLGFVLYCIFWE